MNMALISTEILILLLIILTVIEGLYTKFGNLINISRQIIICFAFLSIYTFTNGLIKESLIILFSLFSLLIANSWFTIKKFKRYEYPIIVSCGVFALVLMVSMSNLLTILLGFCIFLLTSSILVVYKRRGERSTTAGMKYIITMTMSLFIFLLGLLFLIHSNTPLDINKIAIKSNFDSLGIVFVIISLFIPAFIVPFSLNSSDTMEGALSPTTIFILSVTKIPFIILISKLFVLINGYPFIDIAKIFGVISIVIPAMSAIYQQSIKRLFVNFSMVASGLYLLLILTFDNNLIKNLPIYMYIESFSIIGCFSYIMMLNNNGIFIENLKDFKGLGRKYPINGILFSLLILSFAGFPVFSGFIIYHDLMLNLFLSNSHIVIAMIGFSLIFTISTALKVIRTIYLDYEAVDLEDFKFFDFITLLISTVLVLSAFILKG